MDNTKKNLFITFEGIDGAGKSSQIQQMYALLKEEGYSVLLTHEPGGTPLGEKIREILLQKTDLAIEPNAEMILFLAGRSQHLQEVILPALRKGQTVLCDRFNDATRAYQGYGGGLGLDRIEKALKDSDCDLNPDLTFVLDLDLITSKKRRSIEGDRFENKGDDFLEKVRKGYLDLAKKYPRRIRVINAALSFDDVFKQIKESFYDFSTREISSV